MFLSSKVRRVESAVRGEPGFCSAPIEQRASERVFGFENAVKYFGGTTFRKTHLQYIKTRKKYVYLQELKVLVQFVLCSPVAVLLADNFVFADTKFSVLYCTSV